MKESLKVTHIVTSYQSVVTILDSKLQALKKFNDLDVSVISSPPKIYDQSTPAVGHIQVEIARSIKPFADLKSIWKLYNVLKNEKFDIVHSHTAKAGFITAIAGKMANVPIICHTYHGLPFFEGQTKLRHSFYRLLEKIACRFRSHVFSQNKHDMSECIYLIGSTNKVSYEGNGVDIEHVNKSAKKQLSQAFKDYPCKGLRLLLLSRLEPVKRVGDFLKATKNLKEQGIEVSCVIAGNGVLEQQLKSQLLEMQLDNCVNMVGASNRPHSLIAASDIVILCSEKEGVPRSLMEAMALRKPVIATDVLGTHELVEDGKTGFLTPLGDIAAMVEKILLLTKDQHLKKELGRRGFERVSKEFNEQRVCDIVLNTYRQLLAEKLNLKVGND